MEKMLADYMEEDGLIKTNDFDVELPFPVEITFFSQSSRVGQMLESRLCPGLKFLTVLEHTHESGRQLCGTIPLNRFGECHFISQDNTAEDLER